MAYKILCDGKVLHDTRLDTPRVISPRLNMELNSVEALTFYLPPTHKHYNVPRKRKSEVEVWQDNEMIFRGQVLNDEMRMDRVKKLECEGAFGYLLDSIQRPYDYTGDVITLLTQVIDAHNAEMDEERKRFTLGNVNVTDPNDLVVRSDSLYRDTLGTLKEKFFDTPLQGYFRTRGKNPCYLDYTVHSGKQSSQVIRFGENILNLTRFVRGEDIATAIVPLGAEVDIVELDEETGEEEVVGKYRTTIESVNDGKDYVIDEEAAELYGLIFITKTWDSVNEPSILLQRGWDELAARKMLNISLELKAVDLHLLDIDIDRLALGDSVRVVSKPHNIDEFMVITRVEIDLAQPQNTNIVLGSKRSSLVDSTQENIGITADEIIEKIASDYATNEAVQDVRRDVYNISSEISQSADEILFNVSEEYATKSALASTSEALSAEVEIVSDAVTFRFNEANSYTEQVEGVVNAQHEELSSYIQFGIDGMTLGKADSPFIAELTNQELAFVQNGNKVAYINNNKLYITNAEVVNSLQIGSYAYIPRPNGNTSFKWIGG